jgi:hypothetical protein
LERKLQPVTCPGNELCCPDDTVGEFKLNLEDFERSLPDLTSMNIALVATGGGSYFLMTVTDTDSANNDFWEDSGHQYLGWCIEDDKTITMGGHSGVSVYSSYDDDILQLPNPVFNNLVEAPKNLDLVNYIINKYNAPTPYTRDCIQFAIWKLIDVTPPGTSGGLSCPSDTVAAIVAEAQLHEGYVPPCGGVIAVILAHLTGGNPTKQTTFIEYPLEKRTKYCPLVCPKPYVSSTKYARFSMHCFAARL